MLIVKLAMLIFIKCNEVNRRNKLSLSKSSFSLRKLGLTFQMRFKNGKTMESLELSYIALWKPDLNEQKDFERLVLFRNDVT